MKSDPATDLRWDFAVLRTLRKEFKWSIADLSERSQVAASIISKLERNLSQAELDTLYKLSQAFGMSLSDLLARAEKRTVQQAVEQNYVTDQFKFKRVSYGNMRCMTASAPAGAQLCRPAIHREDSEMCWVQQGAVEITAAGKCYKLTAGMSMQFDALQEHEYKVLEDCLLIITHLRKSKRF